MKKILLMASLFAACLFTACSSDNDDIDNGGNEPKLENSAIANQTISEALLADIDVVVSRALDAQIIDETAIAANDVCNPTVNIDIHDKVITIDFGTTGCVGADGLTRKGTLTVRYTNLIPQAVTSVYTISSNNYQVNGFTITGEIKKMVTATTGYLITGAYFFEDIEIVYPNGTVISRQGAIDRTYSITEDDVLISSYGSLTVTDVDKKVKISYVVKNGDSLIYSIKHHETVKGILSITVEDLPTIWTIDFGNGTADNTMTVSDGKTTWNVTITKLEE